MTLDTDAPPLTLGELPLGDVAPGGRLAERFHRIHEPWIGRGAARWLDLVRPHGPWPVVVLGAVDGDGDLMGTLVAVWAPGPLERFDALMEGRCPTGARAEARPHGGVWHFVAVTRHAKAVGLRVGRRLVSAALDHVRRSEARARTLSPAVGLPELARTLAGGCFDVASAEEALRRAADGRGRPVLPILRLHLGAGARLEAALWASRKGDAASGHVTLRFAYDPDPVARAEQTGRYRAWTAVRARAVELGGGERVPYAGHPDGDVWRLPDHEDAQVMRLPLFRSGAA